jgi:hypothetical protein
MLKNTYAPSRIFGWWKHPYAESPRNTVMKERLLDVLAVVALYYTPTRSR